MPDTPTPQATSADAPPPPPATPELAPLACAAQLAERFPAVFTAGAPRPLKLRIQADIQQRAPGIFTKKSLSTFLHRHTTSTAYLKAMTKAAQRVDLDGLPAGDLAAEHRQAALAELDRRRAIHDARRAALRDAQRQARAADDRARAERAALLRAYETSTLTRKNFCTLKGLVEGELDAVLAQARQERDARAQVAPADREPRLPQRREGGARRPG